MTRSDGEISWSDPTNLSTEAGRFMSTPVSDLEGGGTTQRHAATVRAVSAITIKLRQMGTPNRLL